MITHKLSSFRICGSLNPASVVILRQKPISGIRYASLTSAIERGKRLSQDVETSLGKKSSRNGNNKNSSSSSSSSSSSQSPFRSGRGGIQSGSSQSRYSNKPPQPNSGGDQFEFDQEEFIRTGNIRPIARKRIAQETPDVKEAKSMSRYERSTFSEPHWMGRSGEPAKRRKKKRGKDHIPTDEVPERIKLHVKAPSSIPYTTPASEFLYGTSAVEAALRCTRRKIYKLYLYQHADEALTPEKMTIRKMALAQRITVKMAFAEWDKVLDKMSAGRPHNGCILEVSPLPKLPVTSLEPVQTPTEDFFNVSLGRQSQEEAELNGSSGQISRVPRFDESDKSRFPFILFLDGILDPGNMGAVIRSAYYLGVDAIVLAGRNSAPMSPVTIKASAGAAENMTILKTQNEHDFIRLSRRNGWRFLAADSPDNVAQSAATTTVVDRAAGSNTPGLLMQAPTVLMLGNEETGLLPRIKAQADGLISIPGARFRPELGLSDAARVDSLNVSVAAALLMEMLMRAPLQVTDLPPLQQPGEQQEEGSVDTPSQNATEKTSNSFEFN